MMIRASKICWSRLQKERYFSISTNLKQQTYITGETNKKYENAVKKLNVLLQDRKNQPQMRNGQSLVFMQECLERINISQTDLKKLNIIHMTGTKGKGSTSAFVESILRHHGYKTGFLSSPHLVEVRERIRINGDPISKTMFADCFEDLYNLYADTAHNRDFIQPWFYYFLNAMAFKVFVEQKVDVAIVEVGIGGMFDASNILRSPVACGVTSLGYDHTEYLGKTIESIAWHKSGIFKSGAMAFTSPQVYSALQVMAQSAFNNQTKLQMCPDLSTYNIKSGRKLELGLAGDHQRKNASLALQISQSWMQKMKDKNMSETTKDNDCRKEEFPSSATSFDLTDKHLDALAACRWRGRNQIIRSKGITFYIDGAHTSDSMRCCAEWFKEKADEEERILGSQCTRILLFKCALGRSAENFFKELQGCGINNIIYTSNVATLANSNVSDANELKSSIADHFQYALDDHNQWLLLTQEKDIRARGHSSTTESNVESMQDKEAPFFATIADVVAWLSKGRDEDLYKTSLQLASDENYNAPLINSTGHIQVLVTGSIHLVGGFLHIFDQYEQ